MQKALRRQDITFEDKDQALRDDVRTLGALVGDLLKEQGGDELFEVVENARLRSIRRREGNEIPGEELAPLVTNLELQVGQYQPGGLEETMVRLKAAGLDIPALQELLDRLRIEPVFTAHPTEPTRRTILRKEQRIVSRLIDMLNPTMTEQETRTENPSEQMTVADELEHVLFFMTDVLYRAMPPFYEDIGNAAMRVYGDEGSQLQVPNIVRFASWVGGDMDGNPNVNAKTIRSTLARQRALILDLYYRECGSLSAKLSQSTQRIGVDKAVLDRIDHYHDMFPNAYHAVPARHREMPYRVYLRLVQERLQATFDDVAYPYEEASQFHTDIQLIAKSLQANKGEHAGLFAVNRLLRRIETFGFHFMTLDVRQDALVHRQVVGELLGHDDWLQWKPADRARRIAKAIELRDSAPDSQSVAARKALAVFQAIAFCRRKYGECSMGPFIVSMTEGPDDILSVLLLANWSELHNRHFEVPVDIAPLLETVDDLQRGQEILGSLLGNDLYRKHLEQRGNRQIVMIGYSDSNKDSGLAAARWALQEAQVDLARLAGDQDIELNLFHGRGGTISRGGSKTHAAVLGAPPGTVNGRLRVTEQGEIINEKYGLRGIALRTLEQAAGRNIGASICRSGMTSCRLSPMSVATPTAS
jgi:phosphoenolpyruvate carboxylase